MIQPKKNLSPPDDAYPLRRALLSVSDKAGLVDFARRLSRHGVQLLSTGGTAHALREAGLDVEDVAGVTGFPEILDGRVKTLHPAVHGGLLARRNDPGDLEELRRHGIEPVDLVVVNLYPFQEAVARPDVRAEEAVENIDIGGPAMVRAAAKNHAFVAVVTAPEDYEAVASEVETSGGMLSLATRRRLAHKAFEHTAAYDRAIADFFAGHLASERGDGEEAVEDEAALPEALRLDLPKVQDLRYGENPHQQAALYDLRSRSGSGVERFFQKLHGKALSFNNLIDLSAALLLIGEFEEAPPTCAILKHTNPCGVASADTLEAAYQSAFATDRQSPFGGIIVVNRPLDQATAEAIDEIFTEVIIAPGFEEGVLEALRQKKNRRIIQSRTSAREGDALDVRSVVGGLLVQAHDAALPPAQALRARCRVVTERAPTEAEWADLDFAWRVVKHVKSNAIVYARGRATLGIGAGQMSRVDASEVAVMKGKKSELDLAGSVVASDAFFPFADGLVAAAESGARAAIQPGGSVRDDEVIRAANARGLAMVFTGTRHFRH